VRLLELFIRVQTKPRFTAAELAEEFGVSRRTMLRDLSALSAMGVPLRSTPGPGGGYSLPRGGRRLSPSLTVDEALALIASYEALLRSYPVHPFSTQSLSAVTKLRAALPKDVVAQLDRLRRHVLVGGPVREYEAPLLGELLSAALDRAHLKVTYDSIESGITERVIFPYGLYASQGYWYCACFDRRRETNIPMRADRFLAAERVEGFEPPPELSIQDWMGTARGVGERVRVKARVTERGEEELRAYIPLPQHRSPRGWWRSRGGDSALGDRLLRLAPAERRHGNLRGLPAGVGRGHPKQGPRGHPSL